MAADRSRGGALSLWPKLLLERSERVFISRQRIHFDLVDLMGVVHNAAYLVLFERARTDWIQSHGLWYGSPDFDWPYYVVRNEVDYLAPIQGGDEVKVS